MNILADTCHGLELHCSPSNYAICPKESNDKINHRRCWRKRGRRGGKYKRLQTVITSNRDNHGRSTIYKSTGVNHDNLTHVSFASKKLNIHCWNAQSIGNKTIMIYDYLLDKDVDIMVITETWRGQDDRVVIGACTQPGYDFRNFNRPEDKHGGIAIISKCSLKLTVSSIDTDASTFEHACVTDPSKSLRLIAIY